MGIKSIKNRKFISDILLNIFASGLTALILQFAVYPFLNKETNTDVFGTILVMMAVVNIIGVLLGNSLNNIRLLYDKEYEKEKINGDFSLILLFAVIVNVLVMIIIMAFIWVNESFLDKLLLIVLSILTMIRSYLTVGYRLNLNYKRILQHSLIYSLSILIGTLILFITNIWQYVFLIGEVSSFIFLLLTTDLLKGTLKVSGKFRNTFKQYILLSTSNFIGNTLIYADRLIILPFLGPHQVSVFFAATVIGKMSSFILSPISGVVLSYISGNRDKMTLKLFRLVNVGIIIFSIIASIFTLIISKYVLQLLYPDISLEASKILLLANFAVILFASCSLSQTIILSYSSVNLQIIIQLAYGFIYIVGGLIMVNFAGLNGFCFATVIASIFKYILIWGIGSVTLNKKIGMQAN